MLRFTEAEVRERLRVGDLPRALADAFKRLRSGDIRMPQRGRMDLADGCVLLMMPCDDASLGAAGMKVVSVSPQAGVRATYLLFNRGTGEIEAMLEADWLTDARTAATSAVATDWLARRDPQTLAIFGTGRIARAHALVFEHWRQSGQWDRLLVCGRTPEKSERFAVELSRYNLRAQAADPETCASEADVICTCTTSAEPLFRGEWLKAGCHINAVGAFQPRTREIDDETVQRARIVVDTYEGALAEAGDLVIPLNNGVIARDNVIADLHEVVAGKTNVRRSEDEITLFKSVGCAIEDLVAATLVV
jgi:ornithine cyclodeaminase/alanine dehydrogenase-like protein (mu-crystallin family)